MAGNKNRRLKPSDLQDDLDALEVLESLEDYTPANAAYTSANGAALRTAMQNSQAKEVQDYGTYQASRDKAVSDEWAVHDFVRNMRIQIKAQYGESSDQLQSVGLKKKSEYKTPSRKPPKP